MQIFYGQNKFIVSMEGVVLKVPISSSRSLRLDGENAEETADPLEVSIAPGLAVFPHSSIKYLTEIQFDFA
jgi:hypothetical protein